MSPALLEVEDLHKSFGGVRAVAGCSFAIEEGIVYGLIGPNGAGKSSVIDLISGFERPDVGSVRFAGQELVGLRPDEISRLGLIRTFQSPREWGGLTVMDNILLGRRQLKRESVWRGVLQTRRLAAAEDADRMVAREIAQRFRLGPLRNDRARSLSGGQKRLLEFARIAAARPRLLILDEPMGGVNPVLGEEIGRAVRDSVSSGSTVIVVEHNLSFIERTCHDVIVMDLGTVIAQGPYAGLRDDERVVTAYLGADDA